MKKPDPQVLGFIEQMATKPFEEHRDALRNLFMDGYCYWFAVILQQAFGRGEICLKFPYGHIVWLDGDDPQEDIAYDFDGVVDNYTDLIPVS